MNFDRANTYLESKKRNKDRYKLCNNTHLVRRSDTEIAVRLHSTDVITFHKNGDITLNTGGWNTVTTKDRINSYQSSRVHSERGELFLSAFGRTIPFQDGITIPAGGFSSVDLAEHKKRLEDIQESWREDNRERSRISRWLSRARGLKRTHRCTRRWCRCHPRGWGRRSTLRLGTCEDCGCVVERWQPKTKLTVADILAESNITVRMAMAHVYGLERFLLDAHTVTIDTLREYSLLEMPMGDWQKIRALKMTCPSTGAVYISPVEPHCSTVSSALDWYFQTENYLDSVSQES